MNDVLVFENGVEKSLEGIPFGDKKFGNVAATQAKIPENIFAQSHQLFPGFFTVQNGNRIPVFTDNAWFVLEIILKIARRIVASGGDYGIEIFQFSFHESDVVGQFRFDGYKILG